MRKMWRRVFLTLVLAASFLLAGCDFDDKLTIRENGAGTYERKFTYDNHSILFSLNPGLLEVLRRRIAEESRRASENTQMKQFLASLPSEITSNFACLGLDRFRFADSGDNEDSSYVVVTRSFKNVSELNTLCDTFSFGPGRQGLIGREWVFHATVEPSFLRRRLTINLPADVRETSSGTRKGNTVEWICTAGGEIEARCGKVLQVDLSTAIMIVLTVSVVVLIVVILLRKQHAAE